MAVGGLQRCLWRAKEAIGVEGGARGPGGRGLYLNESPTGTRGRNALNQRAGGGRLDQLRVAEAFEFNFGLFELLECDGEPLEGLCDCRDINDGDALSKGGGDSDAEGGGDDSDF